MITNQANIEQRANGVKVIISTIGQRGPQGPPGEATRFFDSVQDAVNADPVVHDDEIFETPEGIWRRDSSLPEGAEFLRKFPPSGDNEVSILAEVVDTFNNEAVDIPFSSKGETIEITGTIIPAPDWDGNNGNLTAGLLRVMAPNGDGVFIGSGAGGNVFLSDFVGGSRGNNKSTNLNLDEPLRFKMFFDSTSVTVNINDEVFEFEDVVYADSIVSNGGKVRLNPISTSGADYYFEGSLLNLHTGNRLALPQITPSGNKVNKVVLADNAKTSENEVLSFNFDSFGDAVDFTGVIIPDINWDGNNGNLTSGLIKIVSGNDKGVQLSVGSSGNIAIVKRDTSFTILQNTDVNIGNGLRFKISFTPDSFRVILNDEEFFFEDQGYVEALVKNGGVVTFNPFSNSAGYFFEGRIQDLTVGIDLEIPSDIPTEFPEPLNREVINLDFVNRLISGIRFNLDFNRDFSKLDIEGVVYENVLSPDGHKSQLRSGLKTVSLKGKKKVFLPAHIRGSNEGYILGAENLIPENGSSIEMQRGNFFAKNQYIHPSVAFSETPIGGYKYWCFVSNYPMEDEKYEDDDLLYSNDGFEWFRVLPYGEADAMEPQLPPNVFVSGTDFGRENSFVPIPSPGTTFEMNGAPFTPARVLKHDPEILILNGYIYLYNFYNFYESDGSGGYDYDKYHRFVVVFRSNNARDWEICRTDGTVIPANETNLGKIFSQGGDGKDNYIRYFNYINQPNTGDTNMQIVADDQGNWFAYYKDYGDYSSSNIGVKRYTGTTHLNFDWDNPVYCNTDKISYREEHPDVKFWNGNFYYINNYSILESANGVDFVELPYHPFPTPSAGAAYKTDLCIGEDGNVFVYSGNLPVVKHPITINRAYVPRWRDVVTSIFKISSFSDVINFAKNGGDLGSLAVTITITPQEGDSVAFHKLLATPSSNWIGLEICEYDFRGGEEVCVNVYATSEGNGVVEFQDIIIE